jgi:signal transduction histidine kinase
VTCRRELLIDAGVAAVAVVVMVEGTRHVAPGRPWAIVLAVLAAVSLVARRRWPTATLAATTVATSSYLALGYPYGPILLTLLLAGYTAARKLPLRRAAYASGVALVFLQVHLFIGSGVNAGVIGIVPGSAWIVLPFALGVTLRLHGESVARGRAEWARQHADEERLRVAREVHDVVGHGLSAIQLQAEIALHVMSTKAPGDAAELATGSLAAISRTSQEALDELRVTLNVLRQESDDRSPLPGLARLDALAARTSRSGAPVRVETTGSPRPVPGPVDLAAYRVVQESLTNVLRHAGPATVTVRVDYLSDAVSVEVLDDGRGGPAEPGQGIAGMRQRVAALGGSLSAGPHERGGFRVTARLPTP